MALPMLTAIRHTYPGSHVTWLCGRSVRPLLEAIPGIDALTDIDDARLFSPRRAERLSEVFRTWRKLRSSAYDLVLLAHRDPRYRLLTLPLRYRELRKLGDGARGGPLAGRSHADEYVRMVTQLDDRRARRFPAPVPAIVDNAASAELKRTAQGRPIIALAPGGARNAARTSPLKRWPLDRYIELAQRLSQQGLLVAVTGDPSEQWVSEAFSKTQVVDLVGRTSIPDLLGVYSLCAAVVAHDSGPFHLATLAGAEVVALFGPTLPSAFTPRDRAVHVLWPGHALPCAPCYDGREFAACDNNLCMQMIDVAEVARRVERIVETRMAADASRART
jgi:heptosyltransferase II